MARRRSPDREYVRALQDTEQAVQRLQDAEAEVEDAREELREALHNAYAVGATLTVLGRLGNVSRQRISAILKE